MDLVEETLKYLNEMKENRKSAEEIFVKTFPERKLNTRDVWYGEHKHYYRLVRIFDGIQYDKL